MPFSYIGFDGRGERQKGSHQKYDPNGIIPCKFVFVIYLPFCFGLFDFFVVIFYRIHFTSHHLQTRVYRTFTHTRSHQFFCLEECLICWYDILKNEDEIYKTLHEIPQAKGAIISKRRNQDREEVSEFVAIITWNSKYAPKNCLPPPHMVTHRCIVFEQTIKNWSLKHYKVTNLLYARENIVKIRHNYRVIIFRGPQRLLKETAEASLWAM